MVVPEVQHWRQGLEVGRNEFSGVSGVNVCNWKWFSTANRPCSAERKGDVPRECCTGVSQGRVRAARSVLSGEKGRDCLEEEVQLHTSAKQRSVTQKEEKTQKKK